MPEPVRPQKITFADMRDQDVRGLLIYCADYRCSHSVAIIGDRWPDDARLSDTEDDTNHAPSACSRTGTTFCTSATDWLIVRNVSPENVLPFAG
jgi:hypothetical protein